MVAKVQKWGNSQGLRLTRQVLEAAGIAVGDEVELSVEDGRIVLVPRRRVRGTVSIEELVSRIPKGAHAGEVDWGAVAGREVW